MKILVVIASVVALVGAAAVLFSPQDGFETEILVETPAHAIWTVLTDPAEHVAASPTLHEMEGSFVVGERLRLTMASPSGGEITFRPRVLIVDEMRELRWLGRLLIPRVLDGEHYFLLQPEEGGTRLVQGEHFRGILLWMMDIQGYRAEFEHVNRVLKARAETLWHQISKAQP